MFFQACQILRELNKSKAGVTGYRGLSPPLNVSVEFPYSGRCIGGRRRGKMADVSGGFLKELNNWMVKRHYNTIFTLQSLSLYLNINDCVGQTSFTKQQKLNPCFVHCLLHPRTDVSHTAVRAAVLCKTKNRAIVIHTWVFLWGGFRLMKAWGTPFSGQPSASLCSS